MTKHSEAEAYMLKLIVARSLLDNLSRIRLGGGPAPQLAYHYAIPHLHQFICAYHGLVGELDSERKALIDCLFELVSDIDRHESSLKKAGDKWFAHLQDDKLDDNVSDFLWRARLPEDATWYREMSECAIAFVDIVQTLLPDIAMPVLEKLNASHDSRPEGRVFDPGRAPRSVRDGLVRAQKRVAEECAGRPWPPLLETVGIGHDRPGGDAS